MSGRSLNFKDREEENLEPVVFVNDLLLNFLVTCDPLLKSFYCT